MKRARFCLIIFIIILSLSAVISPAMAVNSSDVDGTIHYSSTGIKFTGQGMSLKKNGAVRISAGGTYIVSGKSDSARIIVEAPDAEVTIILGGCDLAWPDDEVIYFKNLASANIILKDGTDNILTSGNRDELTAAETEATGAVLKANCSLSISGAGTLTAYGYINNGIAADDDISIEGGTITVFSANDGLKSHGNILIREGSLELNSMNEALQTDGTLNVSGGILNLHAEDDAVHTSGTIQITGGLFSIYASDDAVHSDEAIIIDGGSLDIISCREGLEGTGVLISDGRVDIHSTDDGINVSGTANSTAASDSSNCIFDCRITGGIVVICSGGDGIDSNQSLYIEGGTTIISGPSVNWDAAVDYGERGSFIITGGTIMAAGYSGMAASPSAASTQPSVFYCFDETIPESTELSLYYADGRILTRYAFENAYNCVLLSMPEFTPGDTYSLDAGTIQETITLSSSGYSNKQGFSGEPFSNRASGEFPSPPAFNGGSSKDPSSETQN